MEDSLSVGFIGAGMMASALMDGLVAKNISNTSSITCSDVWPPSREKATQKGYEATDSNEVVCGNSKDAIIIQNHNQCFKVKLASLLPLY